MKTLILIITSIFIFGCHTAPIEINTKPLERIPLVLPKPDNYKRYHYKWIIVTPENMKQIFAELARKGQPLAIIGLTGDDYKILSMAEADKMKLIRQLKAMIDAYQKYYIAVQTRDEKHNRELENNKLVNE